MPSFYSTLRENTLEDSRIAIRNRLVSNLSERLQDVTADNEKSAKNDTRSVDQTLVKNLYSIVIPILLTACFLSVILNLTILYSVRWVRRTLSPTLCFSLSLAVADAYASLVVAIGLIVNSLLPIVYDIDLGTYHMCYILALEACRLAGLIATVLHLLALAVNHYVGILRPLHYAATVTRHTAGLTIAALWMLPFVFFFVYFSLVPEEGFQSAYCERYSFVNFSPFRMTVSLMFFVPLIFMTCMYVHIFFMVRQHQRGLVQYPSTRQFRRNVKALVTTLLIIGTYILGWMPAVVLYILTCLDCLVPFTQIHYLVVIPTAIISNSLIVSKAFVDPIIYAIRMPEIKEAMKRMWMSRCGFVHIENASTAESLYSRRFNKSLGNSSKLHATSAVSGKG